MLWIREHMWSVVSTLLLNLKDFSRSQALTWITYTVKVVISRKRCNIETFLLQTTNRKWYMAYRIATIPMTLSDLQGHAPNGGLSKCNWQYFNGHSASLSPYAIAEPLVEHVRIIRLFRFTLDNFVKRQDSHTKRKTARWTLWDVQYLECAASLVNLQCKN